MLFVAGAAAPLADPDLPMHLAVGKWIIDHGAVPHMEPFAWTRAGAPYFAYSWLAQISFFALLSQCGVLALRALNGLVFAGSFAAMFIAARTMRTSREACWLAGAFNFVVLLSLSAFLRPQALLFTIVPLAWASVVKAIESPQSRWPVGALLVLTVLAANTHILFPLIAVPLVLCVLRDAGARLTLTLAGAVAIGMLLSPYGLDWPAVFWLNFSPNASSGPRTLIAEYRSGFVSVLPMGVLLASLPLVAWPTLVTRERIAYGALWLIGLVAFALRVKGLIVWWLVALPLIVGASEIALAAAPRSYRTFPILLTLALAVTTTFRFVVGGAVTTPSIVVAWRAEHRVSRRSLSGPAAIATEPLLAILAKLDAPARLLTVFDLGSYVPWRAPLVSESIDGRGIFPDSAALPDAALMPTDRTRPLGPWRSADAAIVPLSYPVAAVLDSAAGWERLSTTDGRSPMGRIGLWVRSDWYAAARATRTVP
jgi:hypothetical protein